MDNKGEELRFAKAPIADVDSKAKDGGTDETGKQDSDTSGYWDNNGYVRIFRGYSSPKQR